MKRWIMILGVALAGGSNLCHAKVDLVTLPVREGVQLTIYNSADLTLVRENRALTMRRGINRLQFSWVNTLIDPTSLEMRPIENADKIDVFDLVYPPRVKSLGIWNVKSEVSGKSPVEISYFTSGLSWSANYMGTLTEDEKRMRLQGYVRVYNNSGEDYAGAQTRLVVGEVHLAEQIAMLAQRAEPYGRPVGVMPLCDPVGMGRPRGAMPSSGWRREDLSQSASEVREIMKEGLSEYFLYTIEGRDTILTGWSKRLPSFDIAEVPVVNLYKYEEERYGKRMMRFLSFKNDEEHKLGETPIPGGALRVYRNVDEQAHLSYEGASSFKYIPVGEDVELNLGAVANVIVEPTLMDLSTSAYLFNGSGNVSGWLETRKFSVKVKNTRNVAVRVDLRRNFPTQYWSLEKAGDYGTFEKVDLDTVKFLLELEPLSEKNFSYELTTRHGKRID